MLSAAPIYILSIIIFDIANYSKMESSKKRQEFAISIRRKQIAQRIQAMRSMVHTQSQTSVQKYYPIVTKIQTGQKPIKECLKQLKILSFNAQGAALIYQSSLHHKLYQYLISQGPQINSQEYNDILTVIINLCVYVELDISNEVMMMVVTCILRTELQMISLWLIANIIYQKSAFSTAVAGQLVEKCQVIQFMKDRLKYKFENQGDIVIFNFFCCSFLVVSSALSAQSVKLILNIIQETLKFQQKQQENYWFLSEALADHGPHIGASEYEIFVTDIFKKFEWYCKNKKTKYVKNFLKMLIGFTASDKLAYQKMLKYKIFTSLDFCLQNRFPQIKKLLAQIGWNLLQNFGDKVDIQNIGFFSQLVLEILNIQKVPIDIQIHIIRYSNKFFEITAQSKITKQSKQRFIQQLLTGSTINIISTIMINSNGNAQLISQCLHLLEIFIKIDQGGKIVEKCAHNRIAQYLQQINVDNQGFQQQIQHFLHHFG